MPTYCVEHTMTPLAAGQRWVPTRERGGHWVCEVISVTDESVTYRDAAGNAKGQRVHLICSNYEFDDWIARHAAVLEQDGGGEGGGR